MNKCPHCQAPIENQARFCTNCGNRIETRGLGKYPSTFGEINNKDIMLEAKEALSGRWGLAIGTMLV